MEIVSGCYGEIIVYDGRLGASIAIDRLLSDE